jgi:hypothetical protein
VTATITTTVRVVCGIHDDTTDTWAEALVTGTAGFTDFDVLVLLVGERSHRCSTFDVDHTDFAAW